MKLHLVLLASLGTLPRAAPQERDDSTRFYALPIVRETREQAAVAGEHLEAGRYAEAIRSLQRILEDHSNEVLQASESEIGRSATFPGAGEWALERLFELPPRAQAEYRTRYEDLAAGTLALALRAPERATLTAVALRWPLTETSVHAWWALGDLELEQGHAESAELAWRRAEESAERLGLAATSAARRAWLASAAEARESARSEPIALPRGDAEPWTVRLDLTPFVSRLSSNPLRHKLAPAFTGDTVLVGSTLRLYALDAFSGELRWKAGPPPGWPDLISRGRDGGLFQGIAWDYVYLAPAFGNGIAVAVLQQPFAENPNDDWQGIDIMKAIPERRLHAYDLATGEELWNHAPRLQREGQELKWDGTGSYAQRMMVSGSPTVVGARVLVPCYRMQGRIDYHVACYELATGELLWSTQVVSGQRARNMFGRSMEEFTTPPVVVSGSSVVAQSDLGTLACLDLFSGRLRWETTYRQLPLPKTNTYRASRRQVTWLTAPPVVVGDVIVATPSDSDDMVGLRLSDGSRLWEYREDRLQELDRPTHLLGFDLLVGADEDRVYLSGSKLSALQKPGGLETSTPFIPVWTQELQGTDTAPRAVLAGDVLVHAHANARDVFDRRTGERLKLPSGPWGTAGRGGALDVGDGALFALSNDGVLSGYYDWRTQMERARRSAGPGASAEAVAEAAHLFLRRGQLLLDRGDEKNALTTLAACEDLLARLRAEHSPDTRAELRCTLTQAQALAATQPVRALERLEHGLALATSRADRAALLFQRDDLLRLSGGPERLATLAAIEECWGDEPLPEARRVEAMRMWLAGVEDAESLEPGTDSPPTRVWVALEEAREHVRSRDPRSAMDALHAALAESAGIELARGVSLGRYVRERIARLLEQPGGREAYAHIEEHAARLYAQARDETGTATLEALARQFPHSAAAEEALSLLVVRATEAGDAGSVVRLVREALTRGGLTSRREEGLLLYLAHVLGAEGNAEFERALVARLAERAPDRVSDVPAHGGRTLAELARDLEPRDAAPEHAPVTFQSPVATPPPETGSPRFHGALIPRSVEAEGYPRELHVYEVDDELRAYSNAVAGLVAWRRPLKDTIVGTAFPRGRMILASRDSIECLDERGETLWSEDLGTRRPRAIAAESGVVVVLAHGRVFALDVIRGMPLWERPLAAFRNWSGLLVGPSHVALFSREVKVEPLVLALDLFTGRVTAELSLTGYDSKTALEEASWISGGLLVTPAYLRRPARLQSWALDGGARGWAASFGSDENLTAIVRHEGKTFPVTLTSALGIGGQGGIYELDERVGSLRLILPLRPGEQVMGLEPQTVTALRAPYLFTFQYEESERSVPIRAVHLPFGVQWTWSLPVAARELHGGRSLPMPAVSTDQVAIAYVTRRTVGNDGSSTVIVFVDKRAGVKVDTIELQGFGQASRLELRGLGEALFVLGTGPSSRACLDVLEPPR